MKNRIEKKFLELKRNRKKAFIAFITAGYPNLKTTEKLVLELDNRGVDIIELGVPFSDPMADGPTIQEASFESLKKKTSLSDILKLVKRVRNKSEVAICLMTYYNPIFAFGEEKFVRSARAAGVDGVIVPDLPPEEAKGLIKFSRSADLSTIFFISPTTSQERIKFITKVSRGFIYYVCLTGVTGARKNLPQDLLRKLKEIKKYTKVPVSVGFGVSTNQQVRQVLKNADGVIVGSAIVKKIKENLDKKDLTKRVGDFVSYLKRV
ncbi:MAG: tryptophan synthase subunit alpha [Candidatus Omnitrophica bacterium]|nr:tryptophan synthase subunit alpha [Candidatus Omnitrophota bacterium]